LIIFTKYLFTEFNSGRLGRSAGYDGRTAYASPAFGVLTAHQMPATGAFSLYLTGCGHFHSFTQTLVGFLFRHLLISLKMTYRNPALKSYVITAYSLTEQYKRGILCDLPPQVNIIAGSF
jgi:hypothetical protein